MRIEHGNIKYHNTGLYKSDIREICVVKDKGIVTLSHDKNQVALFQDLGEENCDYKMTGVLKQNIQPMGSNSIFNHIVKKLINFILLIEVIMGEYL